jgi:hypothetical protein
VGEEATMLAYFKKPLQSKKAKTLAAIALVLTIVGATPTTTLAAQTTGTTYWSAFSYSYKGLAIPIPKGQLVHIINASQDYVMWDGADFASAAPLCETMMVFTYGNGTKTITGDLHKGCSLGGVWKYALNKKMPEGKACAELWVNATYGANVAKGAKMVTKQCHTIHTKPNLWW